MSSSSKERLWTKDFLLDTGINFLVYLLSLINAYWFTYELFEKIWFLIFFLKLG